jgi:elongation factor 1-alpha
MNTQTQKNYNEVNLPELFSDSKNIGKTMPIYNVCFIGHVDHGKSTTVSRLLYDTNRIPKHIIDAYEKEAAALQKKSFKFAWFMDRQKEQRERGITITLAHAEWNTPNRYFTMIDAPGHKDFTKNAITGISQADIAVLVIDAKKGIEDNTSTKEHALLAKASGINSIVVALTKVDTIPIEQRQSMLELRTKEAIAMLRGFNFDPSRIEVVPINSYDGWNLADKSQNQKELPGYNGYSLLEALDQIKVDEVDPNLPLRLSVEHICTKVGGTNIVLTGKILSGTLKPKDLVIIKPSCKVGEVRSLQMHHRPLNFATTGANIGVDIKNISVEDASKASIISHVKDAPKVVSKFTVQRAVIMNHPTRLGKGAHVIVHYQTGNVSCMIESIRDVYDLTTYRGNFNEKQTNSMAPGYTSGEVDSVNPGSIACLTLVPDKPIVIEAQKDHPKLCRVILRDSNSTLGFGTVTEVVPHRMEIQKS